MPNRSTEHALRRNHSVAPAVRKLVPGHPVLALHAGATVAYVLYNVDDLFAVLAALDNDTLLLEVGISLELELLSVLEFPVSAIFPLALRIKSKSLKLSDQFIDLNHLFELLGQERIALLLLVLEFLGLT